ncbi:MAG TPA: hypothetical protein VFN90_07285 [Gemmatimonadales bacterium]|nr:hypothetical protein [Gemmatimonadales bacterium]
MTVASLRTAWVALLALYTVRILATADAWHLPDFINLPIHETGHLVFAWGGETLAILGGTLFQLLMPLAIAISFHRRHDALGTGTALWWVGQNHFNIARYVADARAQELPLVGGGEHDWFLLLAEWEMLDRDLALARAIRLVGTIVMVASLWWAWRGRAVSRAA